MPAKRTRHEFFPFNPHLRQQLIKTTHQILCDVNFAVALTRLCTLHNTAR